MSRSSAKAALRGVAAFIFDCDGGVLGSGAAEMLELLADRKIAVVFLTQDTERSEETIAASLRARGLRVEADQIVTCGALIAHALRGPSQREPVCLLASEPQRSLFAERGVRLAPRGDAGLAKILLVAGIGGFSADDLGIACAHVFAGAKFLTSSRERWRWAGEARVPGPGALVRAVEHATHRRARTLGKPSRGMAVLALQRLGAAAEKTLVVTDNRALDIPMARAVGCRSAAIRTDAASREATTRSARFERADMVFESLAELQAALG